MPGLSGAEWMMLGMHLGKEAELERGAFRFSPKQQRRECDSSPAFTCPGNGADFINVAALVTDLLSADLSKHEPIYRWKRGWVVGMADKGWWMTELGDLVRLIIIAMGSTCSASPPWPITPSKGLLEPVKPEQAASEWAGKHGEGP